MLRGLCLIYDVMLLAYPAAFRREYGREMAITFRTSARAELAERRALALLLFLTHIVRDWAATVVVERAAASAGAPGSSGVAVTSIFAPNNVVSVPGTAGESGPIWVLLGALGAFLLVDGWIRWWILARAL